MSRTHDCSALVVLHSDFGRFRQHQTAHPATTPPSAAQTPTGQNHCAEVLVPLLGLATAGALISEARADEPEPLDEEFLDYLLQLEGDEEDWTLFDSREAEQVPAKSTASKPAPTREPAAKSTPSPPAQSPPPRAPTEGKR